MATFDLEERSLQFALRIRDFIKQVPESIVNRPYINQLLRSSSSIGANYIEANDALGTGDFLHRLRISRKEAKETVYWLRLLDLSSALHLEEKRKELIQEATELRLILSSIIANTKKKHTLDA
jgi:four helix bundle protein